MSDAPAPPPPRRRSRLVVKVALAFLAVGVTPIVALGVATDARLSAQIEDDARARHTEVADEARRLVAVWIRGVQSGLDELVIAVEREARSGRGRGEPDDELVSQVQRAVPSAWSSNTGVQNFQVYSNDAADDETKLEGAVDLQSNRVDVDAEQARWRSNSRLVQDPIEMSCGFVGDELVLNDGALVLPMSVPIRTADDVGRGADAPAGAQAALVGDVETEEIVGLLRALAGERYGLRVSDAAGVALVDTFPAGWSADEWLVTTDAAAAADATGSATDGDDPSAPTSTGAVSARWSIAVGRPAAVLAEPLERLRRRTVLVTALAIVAALGLSMLLSVRITRPIAVLESRARALSEGDLSARTGLARDDEIGRLSAAFDTMAASLEQLDTARSAFVSSVSHELRTPLTSLRLGVANLVDGVHGELESGQRRALERVAREVGGLEATVEDLLALTRLEAGAEEVRRAEVDLALVAGQVRDAMQRECERRGVAIEVTGAGSATSDARLLARALVNLVHNAVKHTPQGGRVTVAVAPGRIDVLDEGPGWPASFADPHDAAAAFVRDAASEGHGLGLSIAERIGRAVGARLELGVRDDGRASGARASLVLDLRPDPLLDPRAHG